MWFTYALYNESCDKIYFGQTSNLKRRINEHYKKYGRHYTAVVTGEWRLVYKEECPDRHQAITREKQLKKLSRKTIY